VLLPPPKKTPRDPFALEVLAELPLADAFYTLWGYVATDKALQELFDRHRGKCYDDKLTFPELVSVLTDALTRYRGSGNRAIIKALERNQLSVEKRAPYGKLARLPLPLAEAFLSGLTARLQPLFPKGLFRTELPSCLDGLTVIVLDGKTIKNAAKRLLATRGRPGKLFGGKILAAYLPADGLAVAMAADPDGEANDIRLMPRVMPLARAAVSGPRLWVADAQFCDLDQPAAFTQEGDHFLLRFTLRNRFTADPEKAALTGTNRQGQAYRQDWGWMGSEKDPRRRYVRRIVVQRPGGEDVIVVTDLLDAQEYPAEDLLEVYLGRWQIENVFQQITEVFELQHLIGNAPGATVFQASLCLVIYNILQVLRGYAAQASPEAVKVDEFSTENIFKDMHEELLGLHRVLKGRRLLEVLPREEKAEAVQARLQALLKQAWTPSWKKAKRSKPTPHQPKAKQSGAHTSVHKLLQEARLRKKESIRGLAGEIDK
jgi:Transposase DDE domain